MEHSNLIPNMIPKNNDPLKPDATLLIKLGSLLVHYQEVYEHRFDIQYPTSAAEFDAAAIHTLETDPEVIEWLSQMDHMAFLPKKRK